MSLVDARIEIEEFLKNQVMDFSNYKERVEEKKKTFPYVPKIVKNQVYQDIIRLYLTNYKLDEAKQSLLIMQKEIGESDSIFILERLIIWFLCAMYVIFYSVDSQKRNMTKNIFHRFLLKKCSLF